MINFIESLIPSTLIEAFGWMIIHSLWQGAVLSLFLGLMMLFTRKFSAKSRYFIAVALFLLIPVISVYTFIRSYNAETTDSVNEKSRYEVTIPALSRSFSEEAGNKEIVRIDSEETGFTFSSFGAFFSQNLPVIFTVWLLGMLLSLLKFLGGLVYTQRLKHYRTVPVGNEWQDTFNNLCNSLKVNRTVKILQSAIVRVPTVIGYLRPVVLIPVTAFTGLSPRELEIIIMHELAHIIRRDYFINLLQSLIEIIFFFHPAVWWMSKLIRAERENCCDDIAIEKSGDSVGFAKALANFQEQFLLKEKLAMTITGSSNNLFKRIKRLLNQPNMKTSFTEGFTASCIIFAGILILMINTGSSKFIHMDKTEAGEFKEISGMNVSVDDTTKHKATGNEKQYSAEDKLLELESDHSSPQKSPGDNPSEKSDDKPVCKDENIFEEEIIRGVEAGLEDMDIDVVVDEAMKGAEAGINAIDLNMIVNEALTGVNAGLEAIDATLISAEILHSIQTAIEETDLNLIAGEIISGLRVALEEININKIVDAQVNARVSAEVNRGNANHIELVNRGTGEWNKWRSENPDEVPDLRGALLSEANLTNVDFRYALLDNANLGEAVLDWANFENASLRYAILKEASLNGAKFQGADLTGAHLKEVNLSGQNLRGVFFTYANLKEADLSLADLRDCDLSNSNLREADLSKTDLRGANIKGANLGEAKITGAKFAGAIADQYTLFPPGFNPDFEKIVIKN